MAHGLIRNDRIIPEQRKESTPSKKNSSMTEVKKQKQKVVKNQDSNIKVSRKTKEELEILMKLTENRFAYEMIESMIDSFVEGNLDNDQKRAFKTLASLIK